MGVFDQEVIEKYEERIKDLEAQVEQLQFQHLDVDFLRVMNAIGDHGSKKHGDQSFQARKLRGDGREDYDRLRTSENARHAREHFEAYTLGEVHDHFGDLESQLGAVAFNAMMEFYFLQKEKDKNETH